ncbi:MFS transporter [Gordonia terrae]|uniref:MFS transporter n=1 Tax=Gordonia terrae TaxID=2055 RepID=UPI003F6B825A
MDSSNVIDRDHDTLASGGEAVAHGWLRWRVLPGPVRLMLVSMTLFNVGFYLVVPFLAVRLTSDLGFSAAVVGLVLGLRMASQQGLFFVGGSVADRFGPRVIILAGIALRIVGFVVVGVVTTLPGVIIGVVLIGVAAALFAPAVEAANAAVGARLERDGVMRRTELFGLEQMCSRTGTVIGPVIGTLLLGVPFAWTTSCAAALFALLWLAFWQWFPATVSTTADSKDSAPLTAVWRTVLSDRVFIVYATLCGTQLAAFSLIYLMLPVELRSLTGDESGLGWFYAGAAILVIVGQRPMVAVTHRIGHRRAVIVGMAMIGMSFLTPALTAMVDANVALGYAALAAWIALLHLGQMLMVPPMRDTAARLAAERHLGAHFGLLNSIAGLGCLAASAGVGALYDLAGTHNLSTFAVWLPVTVVIMLAVAGLGWWYRLQTVRTRLTRPANVREISP